MVGLCGDSEVEATDPTVAESDAGRRLRRLARRRVEKVKRSR